MDPRQAAVTRQKPGEVIVHFSAEEVKAPFLLRCGAMLIDYLIIIAVPVAGLLLARIAGDDGARLLNSELTTAGRIAAILLGLTDLLLLPAFTGQSFGKILTGLRIVRTDGTPAPAGVILFRQIAGGLLFGATGGLAFLISVFSSKGRALYDYLAGTVVIYAEKRPR